MTDVGAHPVKLKPAYVILLFSLLAIVLRFFSFFPSVLDHDESTYLEIARMMLHGKLLYVDMIDIKPPGIFLILAGFQFVFGYSIFVMRLLVSLWIAATAFMVFTTGKLLLKDQKASLAAGIIYIFLISTWTFYGVSITPEIFFNLFTITALYLLLKSRSPAYFLLAGLSAGLGFIVKYLVLFDFAAFIIFFLFLGFIKKENKNPMQLVASVILAGAGFFLPFGLVNLVYYMNGHFADLYNIVYLAPGKYPSAFEPWKMLKYILDFHLRYLPVFIFFYYSLAEKKIKTTDISTVRMLFILWSVMALFAVLIAGKTFGHYTIELMLPLSLGAGLFFHGERTYPGFLRKLFTKRTGTVILACLIVAISMMKIEYFLKKDIPREIADYLEPRLKADDVIYTGNYHQIIYYLLKKDSPTKYVHRTLLLGETHIKALDIKVDDEFRHIIAQRPVYIIIENDYPPGIMKDFITNNYTVEKEFGKGILVYRLKGS